MPAEGTAKRPMAFEERKPMRKGSGDSPPPEHKPIALKTLVSQFGLQAKNILSPKYHVAKIREDLDAFWHAVISLRRPMHEHDLERIDDLFRGRLMIGFYISGPFNFVALLITQWLQYFLGFPYMFALLPVIANVLTGIVFQLVWARLNHDIYQSVPAKERFRRFELDLLPVHWAAIRYAAMFWLVNLVALGFLVGFLDLKNRAAAHGVPWPVLATGLELIFVTGPFVRNIGDFFQRHSEKLADRYSHLFHHD